MKKESNAYQAIVIGVSAGGLAALQRILSQLNANFSLPILVVQHISSQYESRLPVILSKSYSGIVKEAEDKELLVAGTVYTSPPNYHMLVEAEKSIALSTEDKVNFSRPSIDILFETASEAFGDSLVGIVLTGANADGSKGLHRIKQLGGLTVVQAPSTAEHAAMPKAAIEAASPDLILPLDEIGIFMNSLCNRG